MKVSAWDAMNEDAICAALLHDSIEDAGVTKEWIATEFNQQVADIVDLVTRKKTETYKQFIQRVHDSGNKDAILVKYMDASANLTASEAIGDAKRVKKYKFVVDKLQERLVR
jgi:(p)ppGpp synthase/HD superfamily hydrolase